MNVFVCSRIGGGWFVRRDEEALDDHGRNVLARYYHPLFYSSMRLVNEAGIVDNDMPIVCRVANVGLSTLCDGNDVRRAMLTMRRAVDAVVRAQASLGVLT